MCEDGVATPQALPVLVGDADSAASLARCMDRFVAHGGYRNSPLSVPAVPPLFVDSPTPPPILTPPAIAALLPPPLPAPSPAPHQPKVNSGGHPSTHPGPFTLTSGSRISRLLLLAAQAGPFRALHCTHRAFRFRSTHTNSRAAV